MRVRNTVNHEFESQLERVELVLWWCALPRLARRPMAAAAAAAAGSSSQQ